MPFGRARPRISVVTLRMVREDLEKMTVLALRQKLLEMGDKPPAKMRKADLIQRLEVCSGPVI